MEATICRLINALTVFGAPGKVSATVGDRRADSEMKSRYSCRSRTRAPELAFYHTSLLNKLSNY